MKIAATADGFVCCGWPVLCNDGGMDVIATGFLWFVIYSVLGWVYETAICSICRRKFVNRGFLNGPYCPIYGCGALLVILLFGRMTNPVLLFLLSALVTCSLEYLTSYGMEKLFHARWWDYSKRPFNIHGRVCLLGAVIFGALSVLIVLYVHPLVRALTALLPKPVQYGIAALLGAVMLLDILSTMRALSDFQKKLEATAQLLAEKKAMAAEKLHESAFYDALQKHRDELAQRTNHQQKRILEAFPKLKLHRHNELLAELREALDKRRQAHRNGA